MAKWIPTAVGALVALAGAFAPQITDLIAQHPALGASIGGLLTILAAIAKSPIASK